MMQPEGREDLTDGEAMEIIEGLLSGQEWSADTTIEIAEVVQRRGYVHQDMLRRWWVAWDRVALPHRAQVSLSALEPDQGPWIEPTWWERALDWVLRHFGGSWEARV